MGGVCAHRQRARRPAGDGRCPQNSAPHTGSGRSWPAGDQLPTGAVLNITAAVWNAGFQWWHSGNKKRTQNVSEYMLVLALCLVNGINQSLPPQPFDGPFSGTTRVSRCKKRTSGFCGARED